MESFIEKQVKHMYGNYYNKVINNETIILKKCDLNHYYKIIITTDDIKNKNYKIQRDIVDKFLFDLFNNYYDFNKKSTVIYSQHDNITHNYFLISHNRLIGNNNNIITPMERYTTIDGGITYNDNIPFNSKKNILFWRGSTTGQYKDGFASHPRYKIIKNNFYNKNFDIGYNEIFKDNVKELYDETIQYYKKGVNFTYFYEFKFVICIPGNDFSSLFRYILNSNCCPLHTYPFTCENYYNYSELKPWVHFVPINEDGTDLEEKYNWCLQNMNKCEEIARNGREYMKNYTNLEIEEKIFKRFIELYPVIKIED
jgi:hypothetical protein